MSATEAPLDAPLQADLPATDGPGMRLRAAREAAGLSLDQVAQQLKLAPRQVKALEDEDFARLPGRTFARGFVRNYARLLNLDGDALLALLPDSGKAPALEAPALQWTGTMIAELPVAAVARSGFARWLIPILLVVCIIGAAAYEWYRGTLALPGDAARPAATPEAAAPSSPVPAVAAAGTSSTPLPNPVASPAPATEPAAADTSRGEAAGPADAVPESAAANPAATAAPAPLVLTYRGPSWTEIRDRSGQVLISRLVAAGSEQPIRGTPPFDVVVGNAQEVVLVYRGKPIDLTRYTRQNVARLRLP
jgi:cytoskeleton protein RodZ